MIAPVAQKMLTPVVGADAALIWFGVMLCVNMQTSFMHPPFGFALFYLRGVAPREVRSSDIYWGALPWVGLQLIMVALVIAFPVTGDRACWMRRPRSIRARSRSKCPRSSRRHRWISVSPSSKRSHQRFRDRRIIVTIPGALVEVAACGEVVSSWHPLLMSR